MAHLLPLKALVLCYKFTWSLGFLLVDVICIIFHFRMTFDEVLSRYSMISEAFTSIRAFRLRGEFKTLSIM